VSRSPSAISPVTASYKVAGEHLAIGAEVDRLATGELRRADGWPHGLAIDATSAPGKRLVLAGLEHVGVEVVLRAREG